MAAMAHLWACVRGRDGDVGKWESMRLGLVSAAPEMVELREWSCVSHHCACMRDSEEDWEMGFNTFLGSFYHP